MVVRTWNIQYLRFSHKSSARFVAKVTIRARATSWVVQTEQRQARTVHFAVPTREPHATAEIGNVWRSLNYPFVRMAGELSASLRMATNSTESLAIYLHAFTPSQVSFEKATIEWTSSNFQLWGSTHSFRSVLSALFVWNLFQSAFGFIRESLID